MIKTLVIAELVKHTSTASNIYIYKYLTVFFDKLKKPFIFYSVPSVLKILFSNFTQTFYNDNSQDLTDPDFLNFDF